MIKFVAGVLFFLLMKHYFQFIALSILIAFGSLSFLEKPCNESIKISIKDSSDKPLPFANVSLHKKEKLVATSTTDFDGDIFLTGIPRGSIIVKVNCPDYLTKVDTVFVKRKGVNIFIIKLSR